MNEITCSRCGADNPGQSKYCNKCGASLVNENTHICPSCGTGNPLTLLYCDHCGTRLIDDTAGGLQQDETGDEEDIARSEPFSLPSRPPGQTGNLDVSSELPEWLRTGEFSTGAGDDDDDHGDEGDHPEWLRAAHKGEAWEDEEAPTLEELSEDHKPQDDLPTWLLDEATADQIFSGDKSTDELFMASLTSNDDDAPRETGSVLDDDLPEWLQGLSSPDEGQARLDEELASPQPTDSQEQEAAVEPESDDDAETASELQAWLNDMEETDPDHVETVSGDLEPTAQESDDGEEQMAEAEPQSRLEAEDDFLNWLSEIQEDSTAEDDLPSEPGPDPLQHTGLPAWLDESDLDVAAEPEDIDADIDMADHDQAPAWLLDLPEEPVDTAEARSALGLDAPDWMTVDRTSANDEGEPYPLRPVPGEDDIKAPRVENTDDDETTGSDQLYDEVFDGTPDQEALIPGDASEGTPGQEIPEDEFLQWLDSLDTSSPSVDVAEQQASADENVTAAIEFEMRDTGQLEESEAEADARLPDWLGAFGEAEDDDTGQAIADVDALPDWLQNLAPPGADVSLPYVSGIEDDAQDAATDEFGPAEDDQHLEEEPVSESRSPADRTRPAFPEWLSGVTDELDDAAAEDHPSTEDATKPAGAKETDLGDTELLPESEARQLDIQALDLDDQDVPREDLPDWFSDVLMSMEPQDAPEAPPASPALTNVPEQLAGDELPQWLDSPFSDETVAEPTPIDEIPEWLRAPLRERLARAAEERGLDESALESGDEWRELLESTPADSEEPQLAPASDTSAWLASLRAETTSDIGDDSQPVDSPIADLQGTIGIAPVVARTAKRDAVAPIEDRDQAQQVVLLRQLARARQEDSSTVIAGRPRERGFSTPVRIVLSILLLATVVIGLLTSSLSASSSGGSSPESSAPIGAEMLAVTTAQPVLLVVDYTPALAGALQTSAADVVRAVGLEENQLLVTSQSAAGLGLADRILDTADSEQVDVLGFIPGGAVGIKRLGRCMEATGDCDDLFGQPVDAAVAAHLSTVAHVVVVTGDRDSLVAWIEQLNGVRSISMAAIVTPAIEPVAAPYLATGQLSHLGVAMGPSTGDGSVMDATASPALLYAHWFVLISSAGGAIYYLVVGAIRARRK